MSWALRATILIAVDAYDGQWCSLDWIVGRVVASKEKVRALCDELAAAELLQAQVIDGRQCYGVHVDAESEVVQ